MVRKLFVVVAVVGTIVVNAPIASAKGIAYAHFGGPGLPAGGVTIGRTHEELWDTGLLEPKKHSPAAYGVSRRDLGPAYRAEYRMDYAPNKSLRQIVYPYAEGGPITFTPRGQHLGQDYESFRGGWYAASSGLLEFLVAHGFPRHDPTAIAKGSVASDAMPTQTAARSPSAWPWAAGAVLALGGLVLVMRLRARHRPV
jgi:hypothetical protein